MAASPDVLSGTFAGRYTIERELGSGATATVYLARDTQRGISVAVKLLRPELAQSVGADRFLREIRLNEKLHHPHIVPVLDSGEHDGRLYFVLPHMEEGSLRQLLQREKQLPIETAIAIARTIAKALDYAHQQNLIHRDVKPENILFTSGQACLADFGIARAMERAMDESTTDTGMVRGTPAYMSPEQASGSTQYDGRSDQYSLACVLYEMLAGVPAFIGPTPEAVIAQRFQHLPRELRVYRSSVSEAVEAVIAKALSMSPADRFATMAQFHDALASAAAAPSIERRASGPSVGFSRSKRFALLGAIAFAVFVSAWIATSLGWIFGSRDIRASKVVIFPVEYEDVAQASQVYDGLTRSFQRWSDVEVASRLELSDALGSEHRVPSDREAQRLSRRLGASRYVRSRLTRTDSGFTLSTALSAIDGADEPSTATASISLDLSQAGLALNEVVSRLLVGRADAGSAGSRSVGAARAFYAAAAARDAFDLRLADSLVLSALQLDTSFNRAALLLAQVRAWSEQPIPQWRSWAARAASDSSLDADAKGNAAALMLIAAGNSPEACRIFESMAAAAPRDFSRWYSVGNCLRSDPVVIRDRRSSSGFRFRSSYHQAILAYVRAFELTPIMHRSFQAGAYQELRKILFTSRGLLRSGTEIAPGTQRFLAYPLWLGDTLTFIPHPRDSVVAGTVRYSAHARQRAIDEQRRLFAGIARLWAASLPDNPSAKEALAISLDMLGDPSAIDTLRVARRLATDPIQQRRIAAEELVLLMGAGRRDSSAWSRAAALGDSLMRDVADRRYASVLAPVAAVMGMCRKAGALEAATANTHFAESVGIPPSVYAASESLTVLASSGCWKASDSSGFLAIASAVDRSQASKPAALQEQVRFQVLGRLLRLAPAGVGGIEQLAQGSDYLLTVRRAALGRDDAQVRRVLDDRRRRRGEVRTSEITPDVVLAETQAWLAIGDTSAAIDWLDPLLHRSSWLEIVVGNAAEGGALLRSAALRAEIAFARRDFARAAHWAKFVSVLQARADPELLPTVERLRMFPQP